MKRFILTLAMAAAAYGQNPVPQPQTISALAGRAEDGSFYLASSDASSGALLTGTGFGFAQSPIPQPQNSLLMVGQCGSSPTKFCTVAVDPATGALLTSGGGGGGAVDSVSNVDGTLIFSPTTGAVIGPLNLGNVNSWTGRQNLVGGASLGIPLVTSDPGFAGATITSNRNTSGDIGGMNFITNSNIASGWFIGFVANTDWNLFDRVNSVYAISCQAGAANPCTFNKPVVATSFTGPLNGTIGATTPSTGAFTTATASTSFASPLFTFSGATMTVGTTSSNTLVFEQNSINRWGMDSTSVGALHPFANLTYDLGTATMAARNLYVGGIIGEGTAPTIANGPAAGTGPGTPTIVGTNLSGVITVTTGTATTASAVLATVTFNGTLSTAPRVCSIQAQGINAIGQSTMVYPTTPTTTTWTLAVAGSPIPVSTTYTWGYLCI